MGTGVSCLSPLCARAASPEPEVTVLCVPDDKPLPRSGTLLPGPPALPPTSVQTLGEVRGQQFSSLSYNSAPCLQSRAATWKIHL